MSKLVLSQNLVFDFYLEGMAALHCLEKICLCVSYNVILQIKMLHELRGKTRLQNSFLYVLGAHAGNQEGL